MPYVFSTCPNCSKPFRHMPAKNQPKRTYCSRSCQMQARRITTTCPECGKEFWYHKSWPRKYCSRKCSAANNAKPNLGIVEVGPQFCEQCGKEITTDKRTGRRFCDLVCFGKWMSANNVGQNHPNWKGGYVPYYGPNWRNQRRNARRRDNYTCQRCGISEAELGKHLDVHHIHRFGDFGPDRYQEANCIENLISLCNTCHTLVEWNGPD